jgi:hypothetical protein
VLALFGVSLWLRANTQGGYAYAGVGTFLPAWIGVALALVSGWLGGELVERLGVGVDEEAGVNAPSSLKTPQRIPSSPAGAR